MLSQNKIHAMDALTGLKQLPDESIDLVVTDPPYNIASKHKQTIQKGKRISTMEAWGKWDCMHPYDYDVFIMQIISECFRVLKPGGSLYMFTAREHNAFFIRKAIERGFMYRNTLALVKKNPLPSFFKNHWRSAFDLCLYVTKGKTRTFNFQEQSEMTTIQSYASNQVIKTKHPTEKPFEIIQRLIHVSSHPGDLVLDPFMGSGTTALAAQRSERNFIGFEIHPAYLKMAKQRLKEDV